MTDDMRIASGRFLSNVKHPVFAQEVTSFEAAIEQTRITMETADEH